MIDTTLMGPGFFVFFQRNIIESGGWEPYGYVPRVRYKFKDEEEKKAIKIIENIIELRPVTSDVDLELALRLRLQQQDIIYKALYLMLLEKEFSRIKELKTKHNDALIVLLH